ncbi:MAG: FeoC-like transcriptional regulator [Methylovulum sp.]|nr:FeoC-like transcriptional regulator [Methylovulum sp.]
MMILDLREFLKQQHRVALQDLVNHFGIDPDALRGMLGKWISKGHVRKLSLEANCGGSCCKCDPALTELYEWVDKV